jgi:hypothetical protein
MKGLKEINTLHGSDKGITHNYLDFYEKEFEHIRLKENNILEIGVLFGNSLRLWSDYFVNSRIYGIDDFSQNNGHQFYNFEPVEKTKVAESLRNFERITLFVENCENHSELESILGELKFDVIIDDASHDLEQQKSNYHLFYKFLKSDAIYVCEDVQNDEEASKIIEFFESLTPNRKISMIKFNTQIKSDDRIIISK